MNKVLITGATGFVGRALCARFAAAGVHVVATGRRQEANRLDAAEYYRLELGSDDLKPAVLDGLDCVVHLAGQAHGKGANQRLDGFRRANVEVSLSLAKAAITSGVRRFVFVSSIGVHGTVTRGTAITEDTPFNPASPYTQSKLEAEQALIQLFDSTDASELTIVRPPLIYGVNAPGNFGSLLKLVDSSIPLPFGMCSNRRSLISVASLVEFLFVSASSPGAANQSFVVADSPVVSTAEIVSSLRRGMDRSARLVPVPPAIMSSVLGLLGKDDMYTQLFRDLEIDSTKARSLVDWTPCEDSLKELERQGSLYAASRA